MNNRYLKTIGATLILGGSLLASPVYAAKHKSEDPVSDSWLTAKMKIALAADGRVKGRQVSVETTNGTMMLRGKVDDQAAKDAARQIAKAMEGVKKVEDDLQVVRPSRQAAVEVIDDSITARVRSQIDRDADLMNDSRLKTADIGVVSNAGVVSLTGEVPSIVVSAQASWVAWGVEGVRSVRNGLTIKSSK
ncbi:MAG: BON domain-containing protein [Fibrobacterota bacterium]|nr:BON domain-containing protein [Fibrobacterota bacterium]QQS04989.1 MAG: BON domain-containing protein [Fibrobacterota bacterium]